ncbi:MAG TPA: DUF4336 domain-containing protein [Polyangiaceae bacterium]|jgi:hypothetical protein
MQLYQPINVPKGVADGIWIVDGPLVVYSLGPLRVPFPTRMALVRLHDGSLFVWSPTELDARLAFEVGRLGEVKHLVSPNRLHYSHIGAWKKAFPGAIAWASPGARERAASHGSGAVFDRNLREGPDDAWGAEIDQLVFRGSRVLEEVVFFHRASRTLMLADLIENFERDKVGGAAHFVLGLAGVADPDGSAPLDMRLTFLGHRDMARRCLGRVLAWDPARVVIAHGRWYEERGAEELRRAFRWLS